MANNIKRLLATVTVMSMLVSALPMQALAAENGTDLTVTETISGSEVTITITPSEDNSNESTVEVSGTNESGSTVDLSGTSTTTSDTTTSSSGAVTESTTTEVVLSGTETTTDGTVKDVEYQETTTDTTITETDGTVTEQTVTDGSETKEWTEKDTGDGEQPVVVAPVVPGETTTATGGVTTETVTNPDGSTTTTTTTDRTVTTESSEVRTEVSESTDDLVENSAPDIEAIGPDKETHDKLTLNADRIYISKNTSKTDDYADVDIDDVTGEAPEGGSYQFLGAYEKSALWISKIFVYYEKDENGQTVFDDNGEPVIEKLTKADGTVMLDPETLEPSKDLDQLWKYYNAKTGNYEFAKTGSRGQIFLLEDEDGDAGFGYCVDLETDAISNTWYDVANLEDSDYYASEDAENHIRAIVTNGYWGTSNEADEDGNYNAGSVERIKQQIKQAIENGELEDEMQISYYPGKVKENGNEVNTGDELVTVTVKLSEVIDSLTAGEALSATQAAVWSYANGSVYAQDGTDGPIVAGVQYGAIGRGNNYTPEYAARIQAIYNWLINLEHKPTEDSKPTVVINEKNSIKDVNLTVHDKVKEIAGETVEANYDEDTDNDVYNTDLNFKLAFVPGPNDDLLVQVVYTDFDGNEQTVIRRLAGDKEDHAKVEYDETTGSYVLKGLILSENKDFNFDLRLEGTQYLENGVYIYSPVGGRDVSQSFVGMAEGTRNVDVSIGMTIKFDVDEDNHVVAERTWHNEYDPGNPPEYPEEPVVYNFETEEVEPQVFRLTNNDGLEEIPEEPVPLAAPVITGDNSALWMAVVLLAMVAMVAINLNDKKRQYETF